MSKCACVDVAMGSYANQVTLTNPFNKRPIGIDRCIADEVQELWALGIETTGCCCGHNVAPPYIGVHDLHIERMKRMGYFVQMNSCRPGAEDSFHPRSVKL